MGINRLYLFFLLSIFYACSDNIIVNADGESQTIVYALLDSESEINFVRIQKSFTNKGENALDLAQINDSIYHNTELDVFLHQINFETDEIIKTDKFIKVNADTLDIFKDEGIFSNSPNILYAMYEDVLPNTKYRLEISSLENEIIYGEAITLEPFEATLYHNEINIPGRLKIDFDPPETEFVFSVGYQLFYSEILDSEIENKSISWNFYNEVVFEPIAFNGFEIDPKDYEANTELFIEKAASKIKGNPAAEREIDSVQVIINVGGQSLIEFYRSLFVTENTISSFIGLDNFSNITNAYGIIGGVASKRFYNLEVSNYTKDVIACDARTSHLNFKATTSFACD